MFNAIGLSTLFMVDVTKGAPTATLYILKHQPDTKKNRYYTPAGIQGVKKRNTLIGNHKGLPRDTVFREQAVDDI